ncbi:MAG TPA: NAD-dependent epimerase/dehydratase family protein [Chitinispirillaceae bacterium]|nr:NAD-dependent epimerase/dehydratase family protein [Chitinispirillaceae bacterium]
MGDLILITGGAGFIGSHLTDELLKRGYRVRILDNLSPQVHGPSSVKPLYVNNDAEFVKGDICDQNILNKALSGVKAVFHFAAAVGVGQSMYQIKKYTKINNYGTSVLLESLLKTKVEKLVVASSMSIYGEGLYKGTGGLVYSAAYRTIKQLKQGNWELCCKDGSVLEPLPTPETKTPSLVSLYALSKYDQERMCLLIGNAYNIPTIALRFFNVYGTRQALSNPYTGVLAIFASRYLNSKPPHIFEDGKQKRDFVHVYDVCNACCNALESSSAQYQSYNIGSGESYTISEVAFKMARVLEKSNIEPLVSGKYRIGDIRHCFADISLAAEVLGYKPKITLEKGLTELAGWLENQIAQDKLDLANSELFDRGLTL